MAVTEWTSEGMVWPLIVGEPIRQVHIEAIRLAWLERYTAAEPFFNLSGLLPSLPRLQTEVFVGEILEDHLNVNGICPIVDRFRRTLVDLYINLEDNGGDWNGVAIFGDQKIPRWTQTTILDSLGQSPPYLESEGSCPVTAAWANQHYNVINKIVWVGTGGSSTGRDRRTGSDVGFAAAVIDWNGNPWVNTGAGFPNATVEEPSVANPGNTTVQRIRSQFDLTNSVWDGRQSTFEYYLQFFPPGSVGQVSIFDNPDYPAAAGSAQYATVYEDTVEAAVTNYVWTAGDFATFDIGAPPPPDPTDVTVKGWKIGGGLDMAIIKYDGANGFNFQ